MRVALEWKGIAYDVKPVHVLNGGGEHVQHEYAQISPNQSWRAHVHKLYSIIGCDIQPVQNLVVMAKIAKTLSEEEKGEAKIGWARYWIDRGFVALEKELQSTGGKFCVRDMVTLVDLRKCTMRTGSIWAWPSSQPSRIAAELNSLSEFKNAHPLDAQ